MANKILNTITCCDCLVGMQKIRGNTIDAIVTDPPAGISFMGKDWDHNKGGRDEWIAWMITVAAECLRVTKPGGHALVWALPRTSHWTATAWENAGWELRERITHIFGSGFPKSLDISKQLDKTVGAEREVIGTYTARGFSEVSPTNDGRNQWASGEVVNKEGKLTAPATPAAKQWVGWGTALKPAHEDWLLLRKPLSEKTVAENVLKWGVGGINIDGCRVATNDNNSRKPSSMDGQNCYGKYSYPIGGVGNDKGRFPANLIHDGSDEVMDLFPDTQTSKGKYVRKTGTDQFLGVMGDGRTNEPDGLCDSGSAARFFYCAKASRSERNMGIEDHGTQIKHGVTLRQVVNTDKKGNIHPTVKALSLMKYLCRLITPPGGIVLDPFTGSGSTLIAAREEGFQFIGFEKEVEYVTIAKGRLGVSEETIDPVTVPVQIPVAQNQSKIEEWF